MKSLPYWLLLPGIVMLAACDRENAVPPPQTEMNASVAALPEESFDEGRLKDFHWRLHDAIDQSGERIDTLFGDVNNRVQIDFVDNRLSISGGCNQIGGSYAFDQATLKVGQLIQTMKACEEPLMKREAELKGYFGKSLQTQLSDSETPLLTLSNTDGLQLIFEGVATAATRYGSEGEQVFFEVQPQLVACNHPLIPEYECLQVREIVYDKSGVKSSEGDWQFLYQEIEGYKHQPGVRNVLRVNRFPLINPPADGPGIAYVLDMTVESEMRDENLPVDSQ